MAVYTEVSDEELIAFMEQYDVGDVVSCKGIAEGVENSNYLLHTTKSAFILTLYEKRVAPEDLPFFLGLMEHLAGKGIPVPQPITARDGKALRTLCGRPAALTSFLEGMWPRKIKPGHCSALGASLAAFHQAGLDYGNHRTNNLSLASWRPLFDLCRDRCGEVQAALKDMVSRELDFLEASWPRDLPAGVCHADLFPDNVFFIGDDLSGFIDFYFACNDALVYDVAVCMNAWCFERDRSFNVTKARQLLTSYARARPLSKEELDALPVLARGAAVRFLLTRLFDWLNHPEGAFVKPKDPLEYAAILAFHQSVQDVSSYGLERDMICG